VLAPMLLLPAISVAAQPAPGSKVERIGGSLYRWVDNRGVVHYSEFLPQEQEFDTTELNKQGRTVRRVETPVLINKKAAAEKAELERQEKERQFQQKRRDESLLNTYTEEREIDDSRDRNIAIPTQAIKGLQLRLEKSRASLDAFMKQTEQYTSKGNPVPNWLEEDIQDQKKDMARIDQDIQRYQKQIIAIREKYDEDKKRFRELKGLAAAQPSKS
jgi:chromosome segregation ATPase